MSMPPPPPPGWQPGEQHPSQPPSGPPIYPAPPPNYQYVQVGRTSGLAIASMVLGILWVYWIGSILAVIFGHIALSQIRRDETVRGRGMAIAGVVLGYVGIGLFVLGIVVFATTRSTT